MRQRIPGEERRRLIIESAARLFSQHGFGGTTTREIARAVGVSEATVFKHFDTEEQLYAAIIEAKGQTQQGCWTCVARPDLFGYVMEHTVISRADEIAASASMLMGQTDAGLPVVIVRGADYVRGEGTCRDILREPDKDLFRPKGYAYRGKSRA